MNVSQSDVIDWRVMADKRLDRLVMVEHDYSVMRDRLQQLQTDYRKLLVAEEARLQRIWELDRSRRKLIGQLGELENAFALMQASFLESRSWRLTRPLRALHGSIATVRRGIGTMLRAMLRVPLLRSIAAALARLVPGLHKRLRARLYPHG